MNTVIGPSRACGAPNDALCELDQNTSSTWRFNARIMPIRANIVGPSNSATRIKASMAACHSGVVFVSRGGLCHFYKRVREPGSHSYAAMRISR